MHLSQTLPILIVLLKFSIAQNTASNCKSKQTCSECIQEPGCTWCINPLTENHCLRESEVTPKWCESHLTINPKMSFEILENRLLTSQAGETVQIKPQRVKLQLRKGEEFVLPFQYAQAENYPVDLYYIMDLSASMEDHRDKLAKLGDKLAITMKNITNNFRLGFGSFVDKVDLPFVSTVPSKLKQPCSINKSGKKLVCAPPYSFKNHMSLNADYGLFSKEVNAARVSGNLDAPEGGFDALMQAIVCKDVIGWRSQARHLIVFSTDADFHIAGDGKLAGVVEPNDAQCHMQNNFYTHDLKLDYPSVSQINYVAKQNNINIVFAIVKKRVTEIYKTLSKLVENSNMGTLDQNSDNVIKLVIENYNKIVDAVTISTNSSNDVEVKIASTCRHPKENGCTNIHVGEIVNFTATIRPLECTKPSTKTITIKPEGLDESIIIELEVLCDCDCDSSTSQFFVPKAANCSKAGTLKCGTCDCDAGFFGMNCECNRETSDTTDVSNCKKNANETTLCSGLGICRCGQCKCNPRFNPEETITGKYCDCDNFSCKKGKGKLCSGRGTCECHGFCRCHPGWTGIACECPNTNSTCVKPDKKNLMCNNHGSCKCGKCECFDEEVRYSGKYCDECPTCDAQRCDELQNCVECLVYKDGAFSKEECRSNCSNVNHRVVDELENSQDPKIKTCTLVDDDDCTFVFQYETDDDEHFEVTAEKEKICTGPEDALPWILGVIGTIILAGIIILIIWKVCTTVHDRREYARFENERKKMRWHRNDNPLYKEATSTFSNPLFGSTKTKHS